MTVANSGAGWPFRSVVNSTSAPLGASATFTGVGELNDHSDLLVFCRTDVSGTLFLDFSPDGVNWDSSLTFPVVGGVNKTHTALKGPRFFRVRFVNDATPQSFLRLNVYFGSYRQTNLPLNQVISQDSDAVTVRAVTEEVGIAAGLFSGYSITNKFGTNSDVDTTSTPEDIWEVGGLYAGFPDTTLETISLVSDASADDVAGTGARQVRITGLDANYNQITETVTLSGLTPVSTAAQFRRAHTMQVVSAGSGGVNVGTLTAQHTTTTANVFLSILPGTNQSTCSAFTVPAGYTAYMRALHAAIRGGNTAAIDGYIWTRAFGQPFRARRPFTASSSFRLDDVIYGGLVFTEKSDLVLRIYATSANNIAVNGGYDLILVQNA